MAASERFRDFFFLTTLHFLNFYNEHEVLAKKKKRKKERNIFKLLEKNRKVLKMGFGHKCGLALFQAKNGFLCYPSRYNLHLNQNQHTATQRRAQ